MNSPSTTRGPAVAVHVHGETDASRGWYYDVEVLWAGGDATRHTATLSWVDHDLISGGAHPPSETARAAALVAARQLGDRLPHRFDAATLRRRLPGFDEAVRVELGPRSVG